MYAILELNQAPHTQVIPECFPISRLYCYVQYAD
jgi:hypothetical protein